MLQIEILQCEAIQITCISINLLPKFDKIIPASQKDDTNFCYFIKSRQTHSNQQVNAWMTQKNFPLTFRMCGWPHVKSHSQSRCLYMGAKGVRAGGISPIEVRVCGTMHLNNKTKTLWGLYSNWGRSTTRTLPQALLDRGPKHPQTSVVLSRSTAALLQPSLSPRHELLSCT